MELNVACDDGFLYDPNLDQETFFGRWVPVIGELNSLGCRFHILETFWQSMIVPGAILHEGTIPPFKELRSFLRKTLPTWELSSTPLCTGRATPNRTLCIRDGQDEENHHDCVNAVSRITFTVNEQTVQSFWRDLIGSNVVSAQTFDRLIPAAFWNLEIAPTARNQWDRMGHSFPSIKSSLILHLAYLNDKAVTDWASASYLDPDFKKLASASGVLLSRDGSRSNSRFHADRFGRSWNCRHHTKLNPQGTGKSAHHGGRIYFCVESRTNIFIGKVCEHD